MKIVYFGPPLAGKTANLLALRDALGPHATLTAEATETDRTLLGRLALPCADGSVFEVSVLTVPGAVFYEQTWRRVFEGVDAVVFVADSQSAQMSRNREYVGLLREHLSRADRQRCPVVLQANKQDLPEIDSLGGITHGLSLGEVFAVGSCACRGEGVIEAFRAAVDVFGAGTSSGKLAKVAWDQFASRLAASKAEKLRAVGMRRFLFLGCFALIASGSIVFLDSFTCVPVQVTGKEECQCYEVLALAGISPFHDRPSTARLLGGFLTFAGLGAGVLMHSKSRARL